MSIELYEAGFKNVHGVDYSANAIDLARKLAEDSGLQDQEIQFSVSNLGSKEFRRTFHPLEVLRNIEVIETSLFSVFAPKVRFIFQMEISRESFNF